MSEDNKRQSSSGIKSSLQAGPKGPGGPGRGGMSPVEKPKNFSKTMKKLVSHLQPFWISIIFVFIFAIGSTLFAIISPKLLGNMTSQIFSDLSSRLSVNFIKLRILVIQLLVLYALSSVLNYVQGWIMSGVAQKISYRFRRDISEKINRLPLSYFDKTSYGDVMSRVTNDVDTVSQTLNQTLAQVVIAITMLLGILIIMFSISWQMTLVVLVLVPLSLVLIRMIVKKSQHYFKEQQESLGEINGHIEEMYSGHSVMRVFNGEKESVEKFAVINKKLFDSAWRSHFLSGLMTPITTLVGNLGFVGVSVLGAWLVIQGKIRIGDIQAFIQYVNQFNQPITQAANIANTMQSTAAAAERVFEFLEEEEEISETGTKSVVKDIKGEVEFNNVVFGYKKNKNVINGFSAHIRPGQKVAIVGPTGAGKTTIVNLLMRFYEISEGSIKVDGVDISQMKRGEVRKMFSMVLQDTWLFNGTIRENISYAKPEASDEEIHKIAKAAHIDHFINSLPQGYDLQLNEEADNISQGEKQLLTIARAMLSETPILILDEATSSVDTRTEVLIQKAMSNLMKNKTSFVIAHRLSTIRDADLILVMNKGSIVEQGSHEELIAQNGFYNSLYKSQFIANYKV